MQPTAQPHASVISPLYGSVLAYIWMPPVFYPSRFWAGWSWEQLRCYCHSYWTEGYEGELLHSSASKLTLWSDYRYDGTWGRCASLWCGLLSCTKHAKGWILGIFGGRKHLLLLNLLENGAKHVTKVYFFFLDKTLFRLSYSSPSYFEAVVLLTGK